MDYTQIDNCFIAIAVKRIIFWILGISMLRAVLKIILMSEAKKSEFEFLFHSSVILESRGMQIQLRLFIVGG